MKKITVPVLNILLAAGVLLILIGLLLFSHLNSDFSSEVPVFSIIVMIFGAVFFYVAMTVIHWAVIFFFGLLVFFLGLCMTFMSANIFPLEIRHLWPIMVLFSGICLVLTCFFKHRKIRGVYFFPAILIELLGGVFLLFSLNVVKTSLSHFAAKWGPLVLILAGVVLVAVFFWQRNFNDFFPYDKDELSDLTDEDEHKIYGE